MIVTRGRCGAPLLKKDHPSKKLLPAYSMDNWYVVAVVYVGRDKKYAKRGMTVSAVEYMLKDKELHFYRKMKIH